MPVRWFMDLMRSRQRLPDCCLPAPYGCAGHETRCPTGRRPGRTLSRAKRGLRNEQSRCVNLTKPPQVLAGTVILPKRLLPTPSIWVLPGILRLLLIRQTRGSIFGDCSRKTGGMVNYHKEWRATNH
jgi:hypothetical protein